MTREELEKTTWARDVLKNDADEYEYLMKTALSPDLQVTVSKLTQEYDGDFDGFWVIDAGIHGWLDVKETQEEAIQLCSEMGWERIRNP